MTFNQACIYAFNGYTVMLPNWHGYFKWDYGKQQLYFINGDYYLNEQQIKDKGIINRNDWYYII